MKTIRLNAFETNSSSTHTIVIPRNKANKEIKRTKVMVATIGEYGWEYETYYDLLSYIYTAICYVYKNQYKKYIRKIEEVANQYNVQIEWEEPHFEYSYDEDGNITYCYLDNGYIDHGDELNEFLDDLFKDDSLLIDAIFNGYVETGNDNDCYDEEDNSEIEDGSYFYFKGN